MNGPWYLFLKKTPVGDLVDDNLSMSGHRSMKSGYVTNVKDMNVRVYDSLEFV